MPKVLTKPQIEHFHSQGFLSPIPVLSAEEVARYRGCLEDFERKYPNDTKKLKSKSHLLCPWVEEIARNSNVLDVYEDLIGPNILCYSMVLEFYCLTHHSIWHTFDYLIYFFYRQFFLVYVLFLIVKNSDLYLHISYVHLYNLHC